MALVQAKVDRLKPGEEIRRIEVITGVFDRDYPFDDLVSLFGDTITLATHLINQGMSSHSLHRRLGHQRLAVQGGYALFGGD